MNDLTDFVFWYWSHQLSSQLRSKSLYTIFLVVIIIIICHPLQNRRPATVSNDEIREYITTPYEGLDEDQLKQLVCTIKWFSEPQNGKYTSFLRVTKSGNAKWSYNRTWFGKKRVKGPFTSSDCDVTVTSLPNLIYCFDVVLLHWAFATATNFAVAGESLCDQFGSDIAAMSQTCRCRWK